MPEDRNHGRSRTYESTSLTLLTVATALLAAILFVADVPTILNPLSLPNDTGNQRTDTNESVPVPQGNGTGETENDADRNSGSNILAAAVAILSLAAYVPLALATSYAVMHEGENPLETERRKKIAAQAAFGLFLLTTIIGALTLIISIALAIV